MSDFLSSISGGIARFALAWLLPTSIAVGLFWWFCLPTLAAKGLAPSLTGAVGGASTRSSVEALGIAAFITFAISVVLAYSSQLVYRVLEGYHLPRGMAGRLTARQRLHRARLTAIVSTLEDHPIGAKSSEYGLAAERLELYPKDVERLMPTRLGNALRSLESFGYRIYGLDSQQFWYELVGTADETVRREQEEARAMVDLFVSGVAVFAALALAATGMAVLDPTRPAPVVLALVSVALVHVSYRGALRNMKDWQNSVRAMVNLGRWKVAEGIGLKLPWMLDDERLMWQTTSSVLHYDADSDSRVWLDVFRRGSPHTIVGGKDAKPTASTNEQPTGSR